MTTLKSLRKSNQIRENHQTSGLFGSNYLGHTHSGQCRTDHVNWADHEANAWGESVSDAVPIGGCCARDENCDDSVLNPLDDSDGMCQPTDGVQGGTCNVPYQYEALIRRGGFGDVFGNIKEGRPCILPDHAPGGADAGTQCELGYRCHRQTSLFPASGRYGGGVMEHDPTRLELRRDNALYEEELDPRVGVCAPTMWAVGANLGLDAAVYAGQQGVGDVFEATQQGAEIAMDIVESTAEGVATAAKDTWESISHLVMHTDWAMKLGQLICKWGGILCRSADELIIKIAVSGQDAAIDWVCKKICRMANCPDLGDDGQELPIHPMSRICMLILPNAVRYVLKTFLTSFVAHFDGNPNASANAKLYYLAQQADQIVGSACQELVQDFAWGIYAAFASDDWLEAGTMDIDQARREFGVCDFTGSTNPDCGSYQMGRVEDGGGTAQGNLYSDCDCPFGYAPQGKPYEPGVYAAPCVKYDFDTTFGPVAENEFIRQRKAISEERRMHMCHPFKEDDLTEDQIANGARPGVLQELWIQETDISDDAIVDAEETIKTTSCKENNYDIKDPRNWQNCNVGYDSHYQPQAVQEEWEAKQNESNDACDADPDCTPSQYLDWSLPTDGSVDTDSLEFLAKSNLPKTHMQHPLQNGCKWRPEMKNPGLHRLEENWTCEGEDDEVVKKYGVTGRCRYSDTYELVYPDPPVFVFIDWSEGTFTWRNVASNWINLHGVKAYSELGELQTAEIAEFNTPHMGVYAEERCINEAADDVRSLHGLCHGGQVGGWMRIMYPAGTDIGKVVIKNRGGLWAQRLAGVKVYVGTGTPESKEEALRNGEQYGDQVPTLTRNGQSWNVAHPAGREWDFLKPGLTEVETKQWRTRVTGGTPRFVPALAENSSLGCGNATLAGARAACEGEPTCNGFFKYRPVDGYSRTCYKNRWNGIGGELTDTSSATGNFLTYEL